MILHARSKKSTIPALVASALLAGASFAQESADDPSRLLEDFVHYTAIARPDLAAAAAEKLLGLGLTNAELTTLAEETIDADRLQFALDRGMRVPELEPIVTDLAGRLQTGHLDLARDPARIEESVGKLTGTQREKMNAKERLLAAGEYAVPALLKILTDSQDERLKLAARSMLVEIGREAVTPLCAAILEIDDSSQRVVCEIIGEIGYPHAAPYLKDLASRENVLEPSREAAERAFLAVGGGGAESLSQMYANLGYRYFIDLGTLVAYPYEGVNNVWDYEWSAGLVATPVNTVIFNEIMAMRAAARALEIDPDNRAALGYYVAANLKRENDLPSGETDPVYGDNTYSPEFYATVFGTQICLDVLGLAIDAKDTPLVRDAIAALAQTTGGANLFSEGEGDGRQPLLEAISYPDRRVQYEAALTLGRALPAKTFSGDHRIVPLLASAVRTGDQAFAAVVASDEENRRVEATRLEGMNYTIVGAEANVAALAVPLTDATAVDLVVLRMDDLEMTARTLRELRALPRTVAAPVLIVASALDMIDLTTEYHGDQRVLIARAGLDDATAAANVDTLLLRASGGRISEAESEIYAIEALDALKDIAISNNPTYNLADAEASLLDALNSRSGGTRIEVARILAMIDSDRAQRALFDAALTAEEYDQLDLFDQVTASVKRIGDRAEKRHLAALLELIRISEGEIADAAARLHGALNLASSEAVELIES